MPDLNGSRGISFQKPWVDLLLTSGEYTSLVPDGFEKKKKPIENV